MFAAKIECLSIAVGVNGGGLVNGHPTDGVFGNGYCIVHGNINFRGLSLHDFHPGYLIRRSFVILNSAPRHIFVRHGLIVFVVAHVVGSRRRWSSACACASGHVFVLHWFIVPIVTHIMGSILPVSIPTIGKGQGDNDEAKGGQRVFKFNFHNSYLLCVMFKAMDANGFRDARLLMNRIQRRHELCFASRMKNRAFCP